MIYPNRFIPSASFRKAAQIRGPVAAAVLIGSARGRQDV